MYTMYTSTKRSRLKRKRNIYANVRRTRTKIRDIYFFLLLSSERSRIMRRASLNAALNFQYVRPVYYRRSRVLMSGIRICRLSSPAYRYAGVFSLDAVRRDARRHCCLCQQRRAIVPSP